MKLDKHEYHQLGEHNIAISWRATEYELRLAEEIHSIGYPTLRFGAWCETIGDWWVSEAELCVRALITHHWSDLEPDGKAFIPAWERSDQ